MKNRFLVRRIFVLLIAAILFWTILTALFYSYVANPVFTRIKARELLPRAFFIADSVYERECPGQASDFCVDLIHNSGTLFGNLIYIVDNENGICHHSPLPDDRPELAKQLSHIVLSEHQELLRQGAEHRLGEHRITGSGDRFLVISVPILDSENRQMGSTIIVQPSQEMNAGIQSLNFALLTSSLIVLVIMAIPVVIAALRIARPLESMRKVALSMSEGDFSQRADEEQEGEIGDLARTINRMAEDLSESFRRLSAQASSLKQIIDGIGEGIVAVDRHGNITQYNDNIFGVFGIDRTYATKMTPESFLETSRINTFFRQAMDSKETVTCVISKDHRHIQVVITPLLTEQQTINGAVGLFRDITQAERLEQTRRDYVANVSHEMRTPLTAMRGLLEPLTEGMVTSPEDQHRYHEILLRETMRLSRLINDMLELSRIQAGATTYRQERVDLTRIVMDVADNYRTSILDHNLNLKTIGLEGECPDVWGNADRIEQILIILIDNAMKFTPSEGVITLTIGQTPEKAFISISDTGIGIDAEDVEHIFDRFYKEDKAHKEPGTGLGLSIAKEIADQMGYEMTVESERHVGSTFTLYIPYADDVMQSLSQLKDVYDSESDSDDTSI
jgi:PAS domain S-box-containing protein